MTEYENQDGLHLFGKKLSSKKFTEPHSFESGTYYSEETEIYFENAFFTESFFDGCWTWKYELKDFTLSEAYHQVLQLTSIFRDEKIETPRIISGQGNTWFFSDIDASQEIKLEDLGQGQYKISFSSCT